MSDVEEYKLIKKGVEVLVRYPGSCLACLSLPYLGEVDDGDDYDEQEELTEENLKVIRQSDTLEVTFECTIKWRDFSHPLIQNLAPGMETIDGYTVRVPLADTPFDQIITALRIVRSFTNVGNLVTSVSPYISSDAYPCIYSFDETDYIKLKESRDTSRWEPSDFISYSSSVITYLTLNGHKDKGTFPEEWADVARGKLERGEINPGWMPPFKKSGGYLKGYYCLPDRLLPAKGGWQPEAARYRKVVKKWSDAYKENYGVYPRLSVDHSICVALPLNKVGGTGE